MTRIDRPTAWINTAPAMDSDAVTLFTENKYGGNSYSLGLGELADKLDEAVALTLAEGVRTRDIAAGR